MRRYDLHGVCVESELALDARPADRPPDFVVRAGPACEAPLSPPPGSILAELHAGEIHFWLAEGADGRWTFRYGQLGEVTVDRRRGAIETRIVAAHDPGLGGVLVSGGVLAHLLAAEGALLLHASCVEIDGRAVAIAGHARGGKTTLAAVCCAAGARLVTDDVMRLVDRSGSVECLPGTTCLRLREPARPLAERIDGASIGRTVDDRIAVRPPLSGAAPIPLAAVIVPEVSRDTEVVVCERLDGRDSMIELLRFPRVSGWRAPSLIGAHFAAASELSGSIRVLRALIPWKSSLSSKIGAELLLIAADGMAERPA